MSSEKSRAITAPGWMYDRAVRIRAAKEVAIELADEKVQRRRQIGTRVRLTASLATGLGIFFFAPIGDGPAQLMGLLTAAAAGLLLILAYDIEVPGWIDGDDIEFEIEDNVDEDEEYDEDDIWADRDLWDEDEEDDEEEAEED